MSLENIIDKLFLSLKNELKKEKNLLLLKEDIIKPIVEQVFIHVYPYIIGISSIFIIMILSIFLVLFLNIRLIIKEK